MPQFKRNIRKKKLLWSSHLQAYHVNVYVYIEMGHLVNIQYAQHQTKQKLDLCENARSHKIHKQTKRKQRNRIYSCDDTYKWQILNTLQK